MRTLIVLWVIASATQVHAEDLSRTLANLGRSIDQTWYRDRDGTWLARDSGEDGFNPAPCARLLKALTEAGIQETATLTLAHDTPDFRRGKHSLTDARITCAHIERMGRIKEFEKWAIFAMGEAPHLADGTFAFEFFQSCNAAYEQLIKGGVDATEPVPVKEVPGPDGKPVRFSGSILAVRKKWCDPGMVKVKEMKVRREAPYRKALTGDKLKVALEGGPFALPGGAIADDPAKLAAASVWFFDEPTLVDDRQGCRIGTRPHTLHRYEFGKSNALVKTTDQTFCGAVPPSAYR